MCSGKHLLIWHCSHSCTSCTVYSYSIWTPTYLPWWLRAPTSIKSEVLLGWSWLTAWLGASSTRRFRERPEDRSTLYIPKTGWWWVIEGVQYSVGFPQLLITLLRVSPASVCLCSTNTGAPSLAGTSSLWLSCTRAWSSTTAQCSAHWIDHTLLRCCSSRTFSHPLFRRWRPRWRRRASPAATCSVSVSTVCQAAGNEFSP